MHKGLVRGMSGQDRSAGDTDNDEDVGLPRVAEAVTEPYQDSLR